MRAVIEDALLAQRGALIGWVPVCLGVGIGLYFGQLAEPGMAELVVMAALALTLLALRSRVSVAYAPLVLGLVLVLAGAGLAKWRTEDVAAPVLTFRYYGPIEGRVVAIDRSSSDAPRLTLDRVVLSDMAPSRTPDRIRVSVHGDQVITTYAPGAVLIMTGHLSPPAGPAEPGGFDFQRHAWFQKIGAVGYTRTPVLRLSAEDPTGLAMRIFALRTWLSAQVQAEIPGAAGALGAAIITGDRSAMGQATLDDLRDSNLAHLLAISGLHMGLLTGFVFAVIRYALALVPGAALRWPTKKIAAIFGLIFGAFYLALSGGNVATVRSFIMVAVMFVAVLLDRRALSLRGVAIAAIIVLVLQPESVTGPGFQMSFSATVALVAVFGWMRHVDLSRVPRWIRSILTVVMSSLIAGLATAPYAAAHFNQFAHFGLIANLLSVPLMGILVMPAAVLAVCLAPFGFWSAGLWLMEMGLRWILFVAHQVAILDGAVGHVIAPQDAVLPVLTFGLLWLVLWQGRARFTGVAVVLLAGALWFGSDRPALLVDDAGGLIGVMGAEGRALSRPKGSGFVAGIWLENDGSPALQDVAAARPGLRRDGRIVTADLGSWRIMQVSGKTALANLQGCGGADVLISNQMDDTPRPCAVFDLSRMRKSGALALDLSDAGDLQIMTARAVAGMRPWNAGYGSPEPSLLLTVAQKNQPDGIVVTARSAAQ